MTVSSQVPGAHGLRFYPLEQSTAFIRVLGEDIKGSPTPPSKVAQCSPSIRPPQNSIVLELLKLSGKSTQGWYRRTHEGMRLRVKGISLLLTQ